MRIFLIWAVQYEELKELILALQKEGHEIVCWVGLGSDGGKIPGAIFHNHYAAWDGLLAEGVNIDAFGPPGKDLIEKLYKTESLILTMMNKHFDEDCIDKRRHLYYNLLQYWSGVIKKLKPDLIIFPTVPHTVYNFVIYELAKIFGIKTIMFEDSWISDRLLIYNDWLEGSRVLKNELKKNQGKNFALGDLSDDLRNYYLSQTNLEKDSTPIYMQHWKKQSSGLSLFLTKFKKVKSFIKNGTIFQRGIMYIANQLKPNLKKEYEALQESPNFSKNFVYLPLSFQPERTTSPQGDMFVDQILMIEILASSLPKDWLIYVKEHPSQWWLKTKIFYSSSRYPGYYQKIAKIKNVKLVPININSFDLINKSGAVALATGTAGWEAILRSKPVLVFGYPWYRDCSCIFRVSSVEECQEALKKIAQGFTINQQAVINYLKSFDNATIHGYIESFIEKNSKLTKQESMQNITKVILEQLTTYA